MVFCALARYHRGLVSNRSFDSSTLPAADRGNRDPVPKLYLSANSHRIFFANAAAANDLDINQADLLGKKISSLINTDGLAKALETNVHLNRAQSAVLNLTKQQPTIWDAAEVEYIGQGLSRFIKLSIVRSAAAAPTTTRLRAYDQTAQELLQHAIALLCEQGGRGFSLRKVARRAGVGLGHLQYYYSPKQRLLQAIAAAGTYELLAHFEEEIVTERDPGNRLLAVIDYVLNPSEHGASLTIMRELREMARDDAELATTLAALFEECRRVFAGLFRGINPTLDESGLLAVASDALSLIGNADDLILAHAKSANPEPAVDYRTHLTARILGLVHGNLTDPGASNDLSQNRIAAQVQELMKVAQAMVNGRNSSARLDTLCAAITRLLDSDQAGVYLGTNGTFSCRSSFGNPLMAKTPLSTHVVPADSPLMAAAAASRKPVVIADTQNSVLVDSAKAIRKNIHGIAVVALFDTNGKQCGFISSEYHKPLAGLGNLQRELLVGLARLGETIVQADTIVDPG